MPQFDTPEHHNADSEHGTSTSTLWVPAVVVDDLPQSTIGATSNLWVPVGPSARRVGRAMQTIAVFGVAVALVAGVVTWNFLGDLERNVDRSLVIGADAAVTLSETIDVADTLIATLDDGLVTIATTIETISTTIDDVTEVADATADLASTLPATFEDIDAALATVESLSATIDGALRALSDVPFGPNYDPDVPFPDAVASLRSAFDPLGDQLTLIGEELGGFADNSGALTSDVDDFLADVDASRDALGETERLLDSYRTAADDARDLAVAGRSDLDGSITWTRAAVVLLALLIAVGQLVPWWLGSRLVQAGSGGDDSGDPDDATDRDDLNDSTADRTVSGRPSDPATDHA